MSDSERVQKILAAAGLVSRRKAEELIAGGEVTINGQVAKLGDKAIPGKDSIKVSGKLLRAAEEKVYFAFYKPRGVISMLVDNENRPNLSDFLAKVRARVFPIGRLDFNSEGLILLTNDGDFSEQVQKRDDIPRVYSIKVKGKVTDDVLLRLKKGARIERRTVRPHSVRVLRELEAKSHIQLVIVGGGAVDIRALCEFKGLLVDKITRTAVGHIDLRGLAPGQYRELTAAQAKQLLEAPELGLQAIERQVEADKPKGQRNYHAKKVAVEIEPLEQAEAAPQASEGTPAADSAPVAAAAAVASPEVKVVASPFGNVIVRRRSKTSDSAAADAPKPLTRAMIEPLATPRPAAADGERPRRSFGDRPQRSFGDRPQRSFSDRPQRSFGDRPQRFGKPAFGGGERSFGDKPKRFGKPAFGGGDRPFGDKPRRFGKPAFGGGDRPQRFARPDGAAGPGFGGERSFGDKPKRFGKPAFGGGDRPFGDRPKRFARPDAGAPASEFGGERSFGDKPKRFGKPAFGGDRPFGDKPRRFGKPAFGGGDRPFGDKPRRFGKPAFGGGDRPFGGKPGGKRFGKPAFGGGARAERPSRAPDAGAGYGIVRPKSEG